MNIAVIFDNENDGGGGFYQSLNTSTIIKKLNYKYNLTFITTSKIDNKYLKKENFFFIFYKKKKISKLYERIKKSNIASYLIKKIGFKNPFTIFLKKHKIEFVIFLGPSYLINLCDEINFSVNIWDTGHLFNNHYPEFKYNNSINAREEIINKSIKESFAIFVDSQRSKRNLIQYYNCFEKKIIIQPFIPYISKPYAEFIKNKIDYTKILESMNIDLSKKYFFYPAQFWSHKNHKYLLDVCKILNNKNIQIIFCGSDKGNLEYIKKYINKNNLDDFITIFSFVDESQLISLYLGCSGLLIPTVVATSTLIFYEALFFEKKIFYSEDILDINLENFVTTFDLKNPSDLADKIMLYLNNNEENKTKKNGKEFFISECSEDKCEKKYETMLTDFQYKSSFWKL
jgi:hypothetical protein